MSPFCTKLKVSNSHVAASKMEAQTTVLFFILFIFLLSLPLSLDNWIAPLTSQVATQFKLT